MALKALIHVNERDRWPVALTNIENMLTDAVGKEIVTRVLSNGRGVNGYVEGAAEAETNERERMERLARKGVTFLACNNALIAQKIDPKDLPRFVTVVPSGMTELVRLQAEGYAYIKP